MKQLAVCVAALLMAAVCWAGQPKAESEIRLEDTKVFFDNFLAQKAPAKTLHDSQLAYDKKYPEREPFAVSYFDFQRISPRDITCETPERQPSLYPRCVYTVTEKGMTLIVPFGTTNVSCDLFGASWKFFIHWQTTEHEASIGGRTIRQVEQNAYCFDIRDGFASPNSVWKNTNGTSTREYYSMLPIHLSPKAVAALGEQNTQVILAVRPVSHRDCQRILVKTEDATADRPVETRYYVNSIGVELLKVILRNRDTKAIIAQCDIPQTFQPKAEKVHYPLPVLHGNGAASNALPR